MISIRNVKKYCWKKPPNNIIKISYRKISFYITWLMLNLNMTANQVSISGVIVGMFSAVLFATGNYLLFIIASLLYFYATIADYCDGNVARYRKKNKLPDEMLRNHGGFFDWMNHITPPFVFLCLSIGFTSHFSNHSLIIFIGFISAIFIFCDNGIIKLINSILGIRNDYHKNKFARFLRKAVLSRLLIPFYLLASSVIDFCYDLDATFYVWIFITVGMVIMVVLDFSILVAKRVR